MRLPWHALGRSAIGKNKRKNTHTQTNKHTHTETLWQLVQDLQQLLYRPYKQEMTNLKRTYFDLFQVKVQLVSK
jgi:hypothetical protein